jgi:hypothetical protein
MAEPQLHIGVSSDDERVIARLATPKHRPHPNHEVLASILWHLKKCSRLAALVWPIGKT